MNPKVDQYLIDGCMRCKYGATPQCKVNTWRIELETLRHLLLETELIEDIKWSVPCYTLNNKNVVILSAFKDYACLSFFKGALMKDSGNVFEKHGESSQVFRLIKFTSPDQIVKQKKLILSYLKEAIEIEKSGKKVELVKNLEPAPEELLEIFNKRPDLKKAFYALTPGRQRGYIIYFSQPKQSATRINRIEKQIQNIMNGKGFFDK
jgi:uncharacterized protein YdeI (YjbR/CyaY-like superfamily)